MKSKSKKKLLRYGENPNQKAHLVINTGKSIFDSQISGKKISYNNIIDLDSGIRCLNEFKEPTSIIVKHTNPCGIASAKNINQAFQRSYESDKKSAFGGIVFLNRIVNSNLASKIIGQFFEMVVAPEFNEKAIKILKCKKRLILLKIPKYKNEINDSRSTLFGNLYQTRDLIPINHNFINLVTNTKTSERNIQDIIFSLKVVKHLKSNAIVLAKNKQTIGLGSGQTNRVDALNSAIKNKKKYFKNASFVCASDGFFPFTDSINILKKNNCKVIAQPGGSINDNKVISFANKNKISIYFCKNRLFKH